MGGVTSRLDQSREGIQADSNVWGTGMLGGQSVSPRIQEAWWLYIQISVNYSRQCVSIQWSEDESIMKELI